MELDFKTTKPSSKRHTTSNKAIPPTYQETVPPTGEQALTYRGLWKPFSYKPPSINKPYLYVCALNVFSRQILNMPIWPSLTFNTNSIVQLQVKSYSVSS